MVEYLAAKRTVDDRALNERVWRRFIGELKSGTGRTTERSDPIRILDVGTGIGTMVARLAEWERFDEPITYHGIDIDPAVIDAGRTRLPHWLASAGYDVTRNDDRIVAQSIESDRSSSVTESRIEISLEVADVASITDDADAVIAAAFLDVVDLEATLSRLRDCLGEGGILYAPCTYDGGMAVVPTQPLDGKIERLYHRHMDEIRDRPGSARAGAQLLEAAPRHGFEVLAVGGGDWVVRPGPRGYEAGEETFLEFLLETMDGALADYPDSVLSADSREAWITRRSRQVRAGELSLIAHNLDLLARV